MRVLVTELAYRNERRVRPGEILILKSEKEFSPRWMKKIDEEGNVLTAEGEVDESMDPVTPERKKPTKKAQAQKKGDEPKALDSVI